jgi:hypothetical protein
MAINLDNPYGMVGIQPKIGTITPPPTPAPTIPGFTSFGDRLATIGGFGDDPNELKTQEELAKMTQAQIDEYTKKRKMARRSGVSEALIQFGEALQGKPASANALARQQARQQAEMQKKYQAEYQAAIQAAEKTNPAQAILLRSLGLPGFVDLQQKRAEQMLLGGGKLFEGQGVANQFYNILLQGQRNPSVRQSPMYKTAYDYLSQPKTETYINEVGQQVTRKIPGMISKGDYLPPTGVAAVDEKPVIAEEPKVEEIVKVSPQRRKTLETQIDTVTNSERKILAFQKKLDELDPSPLTVGEDRADIESQYTAVLLELKNLEELGVLAGPDLDLLQSMLGDPLSFEQFFVKGGTEGVKKQLNNLLKSIQDRKTPIYKELGMEEPEGTITQTTQTAYLKGRKIKVNATGDGWIYSDTGEAVE